MSQTKWLAAGILLALAPAITVVKAQSAARDLGDLVDARASDGERQLQRRGYRFVRTETRGDSRISYWQRGSDCIEIEIYDGRYSYLNRVNNRVCNRNGGNFGGGNFGGGSGSVDYPRVNVDTDGRGNFNSRNGPSGRITRGFLNTRDRVSVGFRVEGRVVTFYGRVSNSRSDREFDMIITDSSEGRATGTGRFRLNRDRNEVEMIEVRGTMSGRSFDGNFSR